MMPSTAFAELRLSPYVAKDPDQRQQAAQDLAAAEKSLESMKAKVGADAKEDVAVTMLAYQTMYLCAKAIVRAAGYDIHNFRALLSALDRLYVKTGRLDAALVEGLQKAQAILPGTPQYAAQAEQWFRKAKEMMT